MGTRREYRRVKSRIICVYLIFERSVNSTVAITASAAIDVFFNDKSHHDLVFSLTGKANDATDINADIKSKNIFLIYYNSIIMIFLLQLFKQKIPQIFHRGIFKFILLYF